MKDVTIINSGFAYGGFTSGSEGIWTRNEPTDPPAPDYKSLSERLRTPVSHIVRPYQAGGGKAAVVSSENGGSGVIKDSAFKKTDGLVTAEKGLVLSIIAADCVPVYLVDKYAGVVGLLHCGWRSAAGQLLKDAVGQMKGLGSVPGDIQVYIGPHICADCYEVGAEVREVYVHAFTEKELEKIFIARGNSLYLSLSQAIRSKAENEGIPDENISVSEECTCHDPEFYSFRRGDKGRQNLAYIMINTTEQGAENNVPVQNTFKS